MKELFPVEEVFIGADKYSLAMESAKEKKQVVILVPQKLLIEPAWGVVELSGVRNDSMIVQSFSTIPVKDYLARGFLCLEDENICQEGEFCAKLHPCPLPEWDWYLQAEHRYSSSLYVGWSDFLSLEPENQERLVSQFYSHL